MADAASCRFTRRIQGEPGHYANADLCVEPAVWGEVTSLLTQPCDSRTPTAPCAANLSIMAFRLEDRS